MLISQIKAEKEKNHKLFLIKERYKINNTISDEIEKQLDITT